MTNPKLEEGWMAEKPSSSRVYHYIADGISLCGKWGFYLGDLKAFEPGPRRNNDCAECYRRVTKRLAEPKP